MQPILITAEKRDELQAELEHRRGVLRSQIGTRVAEARSLGDLSENAEYHSSRDEQGKNESRIAEIEEILKNVKIVEKRHSDTIGLSSVVTLQKSDGSQVVYTLVSPAEADIRTGKLSSDSPIGKLLVGKKSGDTIENTTPNGVVIYEIVSVK